MVSSPVSVNEYATETFTVALATRPSATVTVNVVSADVAVATVDTSSLTFTTGDWQTPQTVTITGADDANFVSNSTTIDLTAANGGYNSVTAQVAVTVTDSDSALYSNADADAYVAARDALIAELAVGAPFLFGQNQYAINYRDGADWWRQQHSLNANIPLGEDENPNSLPNPATAQGQEDLRDAIDALAVAAGLTQYMIDAAEAR